MAENNSGATPQQEVVKANWDALSWLNESETVVQEAPQETPEKEQLKDTPEGTEPPVEVKTEVKEGDKPADAKPEDKPGDKPAPDKPGDEKPADVKEGEKTAESVIEFKADDIVDAPKTYEDGTFQALAHEMGVTLPEESFDAFKATFVPKSELEKVQAQTKESLFGSLENPEVAVAIKLKELGVPDELLLEPTRNLDNSITEIDGLLKLENAELYRKNLEVMGYNQEQINLKMEGLIADGKLDAHADLVRFDLNKAKEDNTRQREYILSTRDTIIKQHTDQRQQAEIQKAKQEAAQVKEALSNMTDFLGVPLSKEAKDALIRKFESGAYNEDFKSAKFKAEYIVKKDLGPKYADHMKNKFLAQGRDEYMKKLSNVPEVKSVAVNRVDTNSQLNDNWQILAAAMEGQA